MMPSKRNRAERNYDAGITSDQVYYLYTGLYLDNSVEFKDLDEARRAWRANRRELMKEWARRKNWGYRPWAFWVFDRGVNPDKEFPNFGDEKRFLITNGLVERWEAPFMEAWKKKEDEKNG
jgi:hypothetical protein